MAIYPNSDDGRRLARRAQAGTPAEQAARAQARQAEGLAAMAEGPGATPAQRWNTRRARVIDAATTALTPFNPAIALAPQAASQTALRQDRVAENQRALSKPRPSFDNVTGGVGETMGAAEGRRLKTNAVLEGARKGFAAQAPGVGNVNLGAGAGYGGGGLKRNSLASSIGKFGEPVYDNRSISRMLARNAGPGGWTTDNLADSEAARDIALRRRPSPGTTDSYASAGGADGAGSTGARRTLGGGQSGASFGSGGGFRGQGGDPQAREVRGDLYGADSERRAGIANLDAAIKSLTTENGGLNMRSKRELYGQLLRQRSEMSGMPYGVQNERDLQGARMANEMANNNANRGIERDKLAWDQDKFGIERADRIAAANAPPSLKEQMEIARMWQQMQIDRGKALQAGSEADAKFPGLLDSQIATMSKKLQSENGLSPDDADWQAAMSIRAGVPEETWNGSGYGAGLKKRTIDDAMRVFDENQGVFNIANWGDGYVNQNWMGDGRLEAPDVKDTNAVRSRDTKWYEWLLSGGDNYRLIAKDRNGVEHSRTTDDARLVKRLRDLDRGASR